MEVAEVELNLAFTLEVSKPYSICFIEETEGNRATLEEQLRFATMVAPKLTLQGGTTEVLRGIIARGLGLR